MARSISQIEAEIISEKDTHSELDELNSASKTAIWRLWVYITAVAIWLHEKTDDLFRTEMQEIADQSQAPTLPWYRRQALNYLHGKALIWDETLVKFRQEDLDPEEDIEDFRIVKYVATVNAPKKVIIKAAKEDSGASIKLSAPELTGLTTYMNQIKAAGDTLEVRSNDPDDLEIEIDVYVDPLVIDITNGQLHSDAGVRPVEVAANNYLQSLDFDGAFVLNHFVDAIQEAQGVKDMEFVTAKTRFAANPFQDILVKAVADAGHFTYDSLVILYFPNE